MSAPPPFLPVSRLVYANGVLRTSCQRLSHRCGKSGVRLNSFDFPKRVIQWKPHDSLYTRKSAVQPDRGISRRQEASGFFSVTPHCTTGVPRCSALSPLSCSRALVSPLTFSCRLEECKKTQAFSQLQCSNRLSKTRTKNARNARRFTSVASVSFPVPFQ